MLLILAWLVARRQDACLLRRAHGEFDIYAIGVEGGDEKRLTTAKGLDDGPEYSPDGRFIYFNSMERTGLMQIWRMKPDGNEQEQVTSDDLNNWFAHPLPQRQTDRISDLSQGRQGHPENKDVMLRLMDLETKKIDVLARINGGQGTIKRAELVSRRQADRVCIVSPAGEPWAFPGEHCIDP